MTHKTILFSLATLFLLSGCSLSPELKTPDIALPSTNQEALHVKASWWKHFNDETLNSLVEEALKNSDDSKLSALKVLKARQAYGLSDANRYPTLNATASATKQQTSDETYQHNRSEYKDNAMNLTLAYEIDLWGKLSSQSESSWASYLSTKAAAQTVRNTLVHEVTLAYFNLASIHERITLLEKSAQAYKASYEFRQKQYQQGAINELLANQAKAQYHNTLGALESLKETQKIQESALSLLIGKSPAEFFNTPLGLQAKLPQPLAIPSGIPSSLLESRPDIQEALENLRSKNALIGVEKTSYFPTISLTGSYGQQSETLDNILKSSANRWSFGPSLSVPIFDFGRIKTRVAISETDLQTALVSYEQTVKKAYKEVHDALARQHSAYTRLSFQSEELKAYENTFLLSSKRFEKGAASSLEVIDAQKNMLSTSIAHVSTKQALLASQAELFKALGSGWNKTMLLSEEQP